MSENNLIIGGVYSTDWDERPHRVLAYDSYELFYDGWWEHKNDWGLKCNNGKFIFLRCSTSRFAETAKLIRVDPLSSEELIKYKLNMPFRVCRHKEFSWSESSFKYLQDYVKYCEQQKVEFSNEPIIKTDKIILQPFGPTGGLKKSIVVEADNGNYFLEAELLWKAHNIQAEYKTFINYGIGLYRSGISKKLASYYIGGYYDLAETTKPEQNSTQHVV